MPTYRLKLRVGDFNWKRTVQRDLLTPAFSFKKKTYPSPNEHANFEILYKFFMDIHLRKLRQTSAVNDRKEPKLPAVVYDGEPNHFIYFSTEDRCFAYHSQQSCSTNYLQKTLFRRYWRRVNTPHIVQGQLLFASFTAGNHYLQRVVYFQNFEGFSLL